MEIKKQLPEQSSKALKFLYLTPFGRGLLKILTLPIISKICGWFLSTPFSTAFINRFIKKNKIDMKEYLPVKYKSFNHFFTRQIKQEARPFSFIKSDLISPCDGLLSAYKIEKDTVFPAKQSKYSLLNLIKDTALAEEFYGGTLLVFRLKATHFHRYCFFDDCKIKWVKKIPGVLHTVRPIALENYSVFCENSREVTYLQTENFGNALQIEIGALLVGKIANNYTCGKHKKGEQKGMFMFGGSTIALIFKKDAAVLPKELFINTENGFECPVKQGETLTVNKGE